MERNKIKSKLWIALVITMSIVVGVFALPTISNLVISSSEGLNTTYENLSVSVTGTDNVVNITDWRINGVSMAKLNIPFETDQTHAEDYSTFNLSFTTYQGTLESVPGAIGTAFNFSGGDAVQLSADLVGRDLWDAETVSMWFYVENMTAYASPSLYFSTEDGPYGLEALGFSGDDLVWAISDGQGNAGCPGGCLVTAPNLNEHQWYHFAGTWHRNGYLKIYIDGVQIANKTFTTKGDTDGLITFGGAYNFDPNYWFVGKIDEIKFFDRELSDEQIKLLSEKKNDIASSETQFGEIWTACVTPNNGTTNGATLCSDNLTITGYVPNIAVNVTPKSLWELSNNTITCGVTASVHSGGVLGTTLYQWYKNGISSGGTGSTYAGTKVDGDILACNATAVETTYGRTAVGTNSIKILSDSIKPYGRFISPINLTNAPLNIPVSISANVSDNNNTVYSVSVNVTLPSGFTTNVAMPKVSGLYTVNYTPTFFGTYNLRLIMTDYANNKNTSVTNSFVLLSGSSGGGGGTTGGGPTTATSFGELIAYPPAVLSTLTSTQLTEIITRLGLTPAEVVQLFAKMTSGQQTQVVQQLQQGGQQTLLQAVIANACVSGDNKCPSFCSKPKDMDCSGFCGDGIADENEDFLSCPKDVKFDLAKLPQLLKQEVFLQFIFFIVIASGLYLAWKRRQDQR